MAAMHNGVFCVRLRAWWLATVRLGTICGWLHMRSWQADTPLSWWRVSLAWVASPSRFTPRLRRREPMRPRGGVVGDHAAEARIAEICLGRVSAEKYGPVQVGSGQVRSAEISTSQVGPAKQSVGQGGPGKLGADEAGSVQIGIRETHVRDVQSVELGIA